jgi:hypothetical protein
MSNIINIALTDTFEQWRVKDNEVGAALGDVATLNLGGVTGDETVISSLNELRIDTTNQAGWIGNMSTLYGSNMDLTSAINDNKADIDTLATTAGIDLLTSSLTGYNGTEIAAIDIFNAHFARLESNDTNITTINTNIGSNDTDILAINTDIGTWSNYVGAEADITAALNTIHAIHLNDPHTYVDVSGDTMTGKLVANGGIGATTSLTLGVGAGTAITVNDQQRLGIGISPHATYKVDVNGQLNATTLSVGGESTDNRYIRNSSGGGAAEISADIIHSGSTEFTGNVTIGTDLVYDVAAGLTFEEYISDRVGDAFSGNSESGGISAVYNDATNKITLAIADDGHSHVAGNIDNFTEEVQDVVGGMVSTNSESGIAVTYDDIDGKLNFNVNDPTVTLSGAVTGSATMTNLGSISIATTSGTNSIPTTSITALEEYIQDVIGAMITGNTETGMAVTYNDTSGKINFDNTLAIYDVNGTQVF